MNRTAIHNIAPTGRGVTAPRANRTQINDAVSVACRQLAQQIRNAVAPSLEEIGNLISEEYQRCQGIQTNGTRAGPHAPLALPADGEGMGGARVMANGRIDRGYLLPPGDEDGVGNIMPPRANVNNAPKAPPGVNPKHFALALPDDGYRLPEGD